jgi:hypothetical protein
MQASDDLSKVREIGDIVDKIEQLDQNDIGQNANSNGIDNDKTCNLPTPTFALTETDAAKLVTFVTQLETYFDVQDKDKTPIKRIMSNWADENYFHFIKAVVTFFPHLSEAYTKHMPSSDPPSKDSVKANLENVAKDHYQNFIVPFKKNTGNISSSATSSSCDAIPVSNQIDPSQHQSPQQDDMEPSPKLPKKSKNGRRLC